MKRICHFCMVCFLTPILSGSFVSGRDDDRPRQSSRPLITVFAPSINRLLGVCDLVFESVDRDDLADSLDGRLSRYNGFAGIGLEQPLGVFFTPDETSLNPVVFLPVKEIDDLLSTVTFGVTQFHKSGHERYEIDRPGQPCHVVVRMEYAYLSESLVTLQSLEARPSQLTQIQQNKYDLSICIDAQHLPKAGKLSSIRQVRQLIEPLLQPGDNEAAEWASLRRVLGTSTLDMIDRLLLDTNRILIGIWLDPESSQLHLELIVEAMPKSELAIALSQTSTRQNKLSALAKSDHPASLNFGFITNGAIQRIVGGLQEDSPIPSPLEISFELAGSRPNEMSLILALNGSGVSQLNSALPHLLSTLEVAGLVDLSVEHVSDFNAVKLHSSFPRDVFRKMTECLGSDIELICGQGRETCWIALGSAERVLDDLEESIQAVSKQEASDSVVGFARGHFQMKQLPDIIANSIFLPSLDPATVRALLAKGDDGVNLTVEPVKEGVKLRLDLEEGFTRLIGREWIRQIESINPD